MPEAKQGAALRKRQQISNAAQMMFIWVAVASVIVGASAVVIYFLAQKVWFNQQVISKMNETVATLDHNLGIVDELKNQVRVLNTNETLINLQSDGTTEPIGVVFDALPASANAEALGASLQSEKLLGRPGVTIDSLNVESSGSESESSDTEIPDDAIAFDFTIKIDRTREADLRDIFQQMERSIRAFSITELTIETQDSQYIVSVSGQGFYKQGVSVQLNKVKVPAQ